jgi:hypothetical protein
MKQPGMLTVRPVKAFPSPKNGGHFFASFERHNRYLLRLCLARLMTEITEDLTGR